MLDKEDQEKFIKEAVEVVEKCEELSRQRANAFSNNDEVLQAQLYWKLKRGISRCRQLKGLLAPGSFEFAKLEQIIEAFDALDEPEMEEIRTLESQ